MFNQCVRLIVRALGQPVVFCGLWSSFVTLDSVDNEYERGGNDAA